MQKPSAMDQTNFEKLLNSANVDSSEIDETYEDESESDSDDESSEIEGPESIIQNPTAETCEQDKSGSDSSHQNLEVARPKSALDEFSNQNEPSVDSRKRKIENLEIPNKIFRICKTINSDENSPLAALIKSLPKPQHDVLEQNRQNYVQDFKRALQKCVRNVTQNFNIYFVPRFIRTVHISTDQFLIVCSDRLSFNWLRDQMSKTDFPHAEISLLTPEMGEEFEWMINFSISTPGHETLDHVINLLKNQNPRLNVDLWNFVSMTLASEDSQPSEWNTAKLMFKISYKCLYELVLASFRIFYDVDQILVDIVDQSMHSIDK